MTELAEGMSLDLDPGIYKLGFKILELLNRFRVKCSFKIPIDHMLHDYPEPENCTFPDAEVVVWLGKQSGHCIFREIRNKNRTIVMTPFQNARDYISRSFRLSTQDATKWIYLSAGGHFQEKIDETLESYWKRVTGLNLALMHTHPAPGTYEWTTIHKLKEEWEKELDK